MTDAIRTAAALLLETRRGGRTLSALPPEVRPATATDAYAVQDETLRALGPVGGWKVGAASPDAEPACAPLPAGGVVRSPHAFQAAAFRLNGLEGEIAFTLARDLPRRERAYDESDVLAALASVHPAIEIVDSRFDDMRAVDPLSALADLGSHGALAVGPGRSADLRVDQTRQRVTLEVDGAVAVDNVGGNAAGDVFRLLVWLANHTAERCGGLRAGQVVTTGSCTGLRFATPPARVRATVAGIGACEVSL